MENQKLVITFLNLFMSVGMKLNIDESTLTCREQYFSFQNNLKRTTKKSCLLSILSHKKNIFYFI